jgi:hypothetical protein
MSITQQKNKSIGMSLSNTNGFLVMLSILIVSAVGVSIATSLLLLGTSGSRTSFANEQSSQARALADTCAEEALERIRKDSTYTGTVTITLGQGTCTYAVTNTGGENRTINASSTVDSLTRKVRVLLDDVTPQINATSWQEVADF